MATIKVLNHTSQNIVLHGDGGKNKTVFRGWVSENPGNLSNTTGITETEVDSDILSSILKKKGCRQYFYRSQLSIDSSYINSATKKPFDPTLSHPEEFADENSKQHPYFMNISRAAHPNIAMHPYVNTKAKIIGDAFAKGATMKSDSREIPSMIAPDQNVERSKFAAKIKSGGQYAPNSGPMTFKNPIIDQADFNNSGLAQTSKVFADVSAPVGMGS